ncbi:MAG: hypothetical protein VXY65_07685, partial [Actinomycetota bacterium]|nr:hypothetical protein [Actinomycetota bacterium]
MSPSLTVRSAIVKVAVSSSVIVTVALSLMSSTALLLGLLMLTVKLSSPSMLVSLFSVMLTVCCSPALPAKL